MKNVLFIICLFLLYSCASPSLKKSDSEILEELRMKVECNYCNPTQEDLFLYFHYFNKNVPILPRQNKSFGVLQSDQNGWNSPQKYTSSSKLLGQTHMKPLFTNNKSK